MKILTPILIILAALLFVTASCSKNAAPSENVSPSGNNTDNIGKTGSIDVNSPAYSRGVSVGQAIASMAPDSREREHALIEAHSMASALTNGGYPQSARNFTAGVNSVLGK